MSHLRPYGSLLLLVAFAAGAACSSGESSGATPGPNGEDGGPGTSGDGAAPGSDGGTTDLDGGDSSAPGGDGGVKGGGVTITQTTSIGPVYSYAAAASFSEGGTATVQGSCGIETSGACTVTTCDLSAAPDSGVGPGGKTLLSAGTVTISGGLLPGPVVLTPNGQNEYPPSSSVVRAFDDASTMRFQAAGASDVGAFDEMVAAPHAVSVSSPSGLAASFPRSADLVISYSGGDAQSDLLVAIMSQKANVKQVTIDCTGSSTAGSFTVPSALLAKLDRAGQNGFNGVLYAGSRRRQTITVGDSTVHLSVVANGAVVLFSNAD